MPVGTGFNSATLIVASSWYLLSIQLIFILVKHCVSKCLEEEGTLNFKFPAELLQQYYSRNDDRNVCREKCSRHSVLTVGSVELLS